MSAILRRTHKQENDIGGYSWELDGTAVDGLHQNLAVLITLVQVLGLTLDDVFLEHRHDLQAASLSQRGSSLHKQLSLGLTMLQQVSDHNIYSCSHRGPHTVFILGALECCDTRRA